MPLARVMRRQIDMGRHTPSRTLLHGCVLHVPDREQGKPLSIDLTDAIAVLFAGSAEVTARDAALAAFRTGWRALRDKRTADAIAAFDRATDPIVAEDAAYWAAIASERAGDLTDAERRYAEFLARFAMSPRVTEIGAALVRLRRSSISCS